MVVERSCGALISPRPPYQPCNCKEYRPSVQGPQTPASQPSAGRYFVPRADSLWTSGGLAIRALVATLEVTRGPCQGELLRLVIHPRQLPDKLRSLRAFQDYLALPVPAVPVYEDLAALRDPARKPFSGHRPPVVGGLARPMRTALREALLWRRDGRSVRAPWHRCRGSRQLQRRGTDQGLPVRTDVRCSPRASR